MPRRPPAPAHSRPPALEDVLSALDGIAWIVDEAGTITHLGRESWDRFAGGHVRARSENVLGRGMLQFITGPEMRDAYRRFLDAVLLRRIHRVAFSYRCDAPDVHRQMKLTISPIIHAGEVCGALFHSQTLSEQERPPLDLFDHEAILAAMRAQSGLPYLVMCGFCQRVRQPEDQGPAAWMEAEAYYRAGGSSRVRLSHGICHDCQRDVIDRNLDGMPDHSRSEGRPPRNE